MSLTRVAAALIWREDRFLICQRPEHKSCGLLWEFVGGKLEPGETAREALVRECREELGIEVAPGELFYEVIHKYPDITVKLELFCAGIASGEPMLLEHNAIRWITVDEIEKFNFCPADKDILAKIRAVYGRADNAKQRLFDEQKALLDTFLKTGALDRASYEKSLGGLKEKLGL